MRILVTGGGGFLGSNIARALHSQGHEVVSFSRGDYPWMARSGIESIPGDLADFSAVSGAVRGCDVVFHVGAKAGIWGTYDEYYRANALGTENVIKSCQEHKVDRLIYTCSPSVVFDGTDQEGVDESKPYPDKFLADYPKTKAMAEKMVVEANGQDLATVSLRPHLTLGPGDHHLMPRIIDRARKGRLQLVGDGKNKVDTVYIDNCVDAHILAMERLKPGAIISGKPYFITNGEPMEVKEIMDSILASAGLPPVTKKIPQWVAYGVGAMMETAYRLMGRSDEPLMTRFLALELSTAHWFDISAARRDLGYEPRVSMEEGFRRMGEHFKKEAGSSE